MNLVVVPFHDWRKSENEGFRTRDVHFIKAFENNNNVEKILVINRPFTVVELLFKKNNTKLEGKLIYQKGGFSITQTSKKIYVIDYKSKDIIGQLALRHNWFIKKYGDEKLISFTLKAQKILNITKAYLICQNVFAYKYLLKFNAEKKLFDAWDNFTKFPDYSHMKAEIESGYKLIGENVKTWTTNSDENRIFYIEKFKADKIFVIKNGVNKDFVKGCIEIPSDLKDIPKPIVGYGGKISYLLDTDLINYITQQNPKLSFVFVGYVLDKDNFKKIIKRQNMYFLGDKKYDVYPCYVKNFDIGIVPYRIKDKQHGGDSIKAYEYLQAGINVIGTKGNGLLDLERYLHLADNKYEFSKLLNSDLKSRDTFNVKDFSWQTKADRIIKLLEQ